jgi:hypothetical protein
MTRLASFPRFAASLAAMSLCLAACGDGGTDPPPPPPPGEPAVAVALSAPSLAVVQGDGAAVTVTVARQGGFAGAVTLALADAPEGVTASFDPPSIIGDASTSTLSVTIGGAVRPGTYATRVQASGAGIDAVTQPLTLTVSEAAAGAFAIALDPASVSVAAGGSVTAAVGVGRTGGFAGPVTLAVTGAPAGVTASVAPAVVPGGASSATLTVAAGAAAAPGSYALTIQATAEGMSTQTATLSVTVTAAPSSGLSGTITLARGVVESLYDPGEVVDHNLATGASTLRFTGIDPHRVRTGETAYLARLEAGSIADFGVVVADARGVPGPPLYVCQDFSLTLNRICHTPRLSPDGRLVAFGASAGGGSVCKDSYDLYYASYVIVRDRSGNEVARFEGFHYPDWLPDGRLLMTGSACRNAGIWVTDATLGTLTRVDGGQVATPAFGPVISRDGGRALFVWNDQLWSLTLDGQSTLTKLTAFDRAVVAGTWSPDGTMVGALMMAIAGGSTPLEALVVFRPGDSQATAVPLPFIPYGPISWH